MLQNIILDFDGTMLDTGPGIENGLNYAAKRMGLDIDCSKRELYIGPPIIQYPRHILGLGEAESEKFVQIYREYYKAKGILECTRYPGILEALSRWHKEGYRLYVCTSKKESSAEVQAKLCGISPFLHGMVGARGEISNKTELLALLLAQEQLNPSCSVMVGDRDTDVLAAKTCGTHSVGVLYGYGSEDEMRACAPDGIAVSVAELESFVKELVTGA